MLQPLVYSKFTLVTPDDAALDAAPLEPYPTNPASKFRIVTLMSQPAVQVVLPPPAMFEDLVSVRPLAAMPGPSAQPPHPALHFAQGIAAWFAAAAQRSNAPLAAITTLLTPWTDSRWTPAGKPNLFTQPPRLPGWR